MIRFDGVSWIDETGGDVCGVNNGDNSPHVPSQTTRITLEDISRYAPAIVELPQGWRAEVSVIPDEDMGPPWKEHDGHGPVRELYTRVGLHEVRRGQRDKRPGERVLDDGRGEVIGYYDFAEAVRIARRDGWGCGNDAHKHATKRARAACAVESDFQRMQAWCEDKWQWIGVKVTLMDSEGGKVADDSLWGIESDGEYWREVAAELINELAAGVILPPYGAGDDSAADSAEVTQ